MVESRRKKPTSLSAGYGNGVHQSYYLPLQHVSRPTQDLDDAEIRT